MESPATITADPAAEQSETAMAQAHAPSFLVIDDDTVQRVTMGKVGSKAGYAVTTVANVEDAINELSRQKFDCITLDLLLGGQNGMLLLSEVAQRSPNALLIVVSSASAAVREASLTLAKNFRLNTFELPKPVDLAVLREVLQSHSKTPKG